ncbi:MAG: hypothetical protein EHM91_02190 [Planctomycetota bacterium]|nr:MAG: hypothetical protein EHM91_02190 [Planctomycetota bacterium]
MKYPVGVIGLGLLAAVCSAAAAQDEKKTQDRKEQAPSVRDSRLISSSATVEAIDHKKRMITLRGPQGDKITFRVDDQVKNLPQVKVGDKIVVDYLETIAIQVVKPGESEAEQETVVESAEPGEKPAVAVVEKTSVTATIEKIDRTMPSITLRIPDGTLVTLKVRHPERLKLVKIGDELKITFEKAVVVAVEPATKSAR